MIADIYDDDELYSIIWDFNGEQVSSRVGEGREGVITLTHSYSPLTHDSLHTHTGATSSRGNLHVLSWERYEASSKCCCGGAHTTV